MHKPAQKQFDALVAPHLEILFRMAYRLVRNTADAQDLVHRVLPVYYAWPRRTGESGPVFGQGGSTASAGSSFDQAIALRIVERLIPDAFTLKDSAAGNPAVVLSAKGEIIRAGRVNYGKGGAMNQILKDQLVPDVTTNSFSSARLKNNRGETADVTFAWEVPPEMAKAMEEARRKASEQAAQR